MRDGSLLIITGHEVATLVEGQELELIRIVKRAYEAHSMGHSSLPPSCFLRFPGDQRNRIIALPAYLGQDVGAAGIKWVSSFPGNLSQGLDRASASIILNSISTGRVEAVIEGSLISGRRTAASAALAAQYLRDGRDYATVGIVGCGFINFEVLRFLRASSPGIRELIIHDLSPERALQFKEKCHSAFDQLEINLAADLSAVLGQCSLISIATTAVKSYIDNLSDCRPGSTILHISLRDFSPEAILAGDNVVDDVDHVCREQTSLHLAEQLKGNRDFIRCTLADVLRGQAEAKKDRNSITIFSPFGLGVLDLAVSAFVRDLAVERGYGTRIKEFLPTSWIEKN